MGFTNITGVFSRYFVVGFFLPTYAALLALWLLSSNAFIPDTLASHSQTAQVLILGAVALVLATALSGLSYYIARIYEGYPLAHVRNLPIGKHLYKRAIARQERKFDQLRSIRDDKSRPGLDRGGAAASLDKWFPQHSSDLLPTRVGNAIRAFEQHSNVRWGLDGVTAWPRIEAMLSSDERELVTDSKSTFYLFVNASLGASVIGVCLVFDKAINTPGPAWTWVLYAIPFLVSYLLYRAAISPATEWGDNVRACIDLHRLDMYDKLGVRQPTSFSDELKLADRVNRALLFAHPLLRDDLWRTTERAEPVSEQQAPAVRRGLFGCLKRKQRNG